MARRRGANRENSRRGGRDDAAPTPRPAVVPARAPAAPHQPGQSDAGGATQLRLAWRRFRRNRPAMIAAAVVLGMALMASLAPLLAPENIYDPAAADVFHASDKAPTMDAGLRYLFGADYSGRSVLAQIIWGARFTLLIGLTAAGGSTLIGVGLGALAGYAGGWADAALMRLVDVALSLPGLPILLIAAATFGRGHTPVPLMIALFVALRWAYIARLVRGLVRGLRHLEYVEAARAVGASPARIIARHLLPNALRPIMASATVGLAGIILSEGAIDYLGIGLQYPDTSWGSVLAFAGQDPGGIAAAWWVTVFPGLFLVALVGAIGVLGDGLGDALDTADGRVP